MCVIKLSFRTGLGYNLPSCSLNRTEISERVYLDIDKFPLKLIESEDPGISSDTTGLIKQANAANKINALYLVEFIQSEPLLTI